MKKTEKAVSGEVRRIPLKEIVPSANNPRKTFNADELNELAESIKENGLLQPITVRPIKKEEEGSDEFAKYEIVCGERRYRATQLTGAEEIDCIVKELDDKQALTAMIFENMQRKDVDPMEEANAIDRLVNEFGVEVVQVAKMLGKSETFVRSRLRLNTTIDEFVDLMQNGPLVLTHLLEISKLPQEQQKVLYETNFTPECIARWKYKFPNIPQLKEMIDADVMMKLDKAVFSLVDETFEDADGTISPCSKCPFNTQNDPANAGDVTAPRCMKRSCFLCKTKQHIIREAKLQQSDGKEIVYAGSEQENAEIIAYAKEQGLELSPIGIRKTVIDPEEPKREDFTEEEFYEKRHQAWAHQKAIFDIGIKDGNIVPVYEVSFNGHLSGMTKFVYNVKDEDMGLNQESRQMRQEQAMKYKGQLSELTDKRHDEKIERYRKAVEEGDYSRLNTAMGATENDVLIALMLMHLSYDFKQSLGLEWTTDRDFLKNYKDKLQQNRNAIKREFIRQSLAEKSVNFAKGLQGILEIFVSDQFPQVKEVITKELDDKYAKQRDNLKKKIEDLKSDVKKLREAEQAKEEEPAKEAPAEEQPEESGAVVIDGVKVAEVNHIDATEEAPAEAPAEEQTEAPAEAPAEEATATEEAAPAETPSKPKKEKKGKKGKK